MNGLDSYCDYLEGLSRDTLADFDRHVAPDVHFKDPFNDVNGRDAMRRVFDDMFDHVENLSFRIHNRMNDGDAAVIVWTLAGRIMNSDWAVDGASVLKFDEAGKLSEHIDHWDAAAGLYEKMPVIGWFIGRIRKRLEVGD